MGFQHQLFDMMDYLFFGNMQVIKVLEDIKKYYPIGISRFNPDYWQYEETILRETLCSQKLNAKDYRRWRTFVKKQSENNEGVLSCDYGAPLTLPSYYGSYLLDEQKIEKVIYRREIRFHISVLASYYTIYGLDKISVKNIDGIFVEFEPLLFISPLDIYKPWFSTLQDKIETSYKDYKFLNFSILQNRPKALSIPAANVKDGQDASIFNAFFSSEDITNYKTMGDTYYNK